MSTSATRVCPADPSPRHPACAAAAAATTSAKGCAFALAVALVAFHALTGKQVRELQLTDIIDGRLLLGGRDFPLAAPARTRLAAGSTTATRPGPTAPTRICSSTDAPHPGSSPSAATLPGRGPHCAPGARARTAFCMRSTPPAGTSAASVTCSGSASTAPPATSRPLSTAISPSKVIAYRDPECAQTAVVPGALQDQPMFSICTADLPSSERQPDTNYARGLAIRT